MTTHSSSGSNQDPAGYVDWLLDHAMLEQGAAISRRYAGNGAMWQRPYAATQPRAASALASVWFAAYPGAIITRPGQSVLGALGEPALWRAFAEVGIQALHTGPMKRAGGVSGVLGSTDQPEASDPAWSSDGPP